MDTHNRFIRRIFEKFSVSQLLMNRNIKLAFDDTILEYQKGYTKNFVYSTIADKNLKGLRVLSILKSQKVDTLDFLGEFDFLKVLMISVINDQHRYDFLNKLKNLEELHVDLSGQHEINLGNLKNLRRLGLEWRKGKIRGLDSCGELNYLALSEYNEENFSPFTSCRNLKTLVVKTSTIKTLSGLSNCLLLENLLLANCKRLKSLNDICTLKNLTSLRIEACKKIVNWDSLNNLPNLQSLLLIDCGIIPSLSFIRNSPSLKEFRMIGSTKVLDGDMSPLLGIETVVLP